MPMLKLHLDEEEIAPVRRLAQELNLRPEDVAYAALDQLMMAQDSGEIRSAILYAHSWRTSNLPQWADSARSVHAYEGMPDDYPAPR